MDEQLKRRLIGATVLVALAVIFVPMLLEHEPAVDLNTATPPPIPAEPQRRFDPALAQAVTPARTPPTPSPRPAVTAEPAEAPATAALPPRLAPAPVKPPKTSPSAMPRSWVVQVASLRSRKQAMALVKKLRRAGLDTLDPRPVQVKGRRHYRVIVGPEATRHNAERHLPLIRKITGSKGLVMRYP